MAYVRPVYPRRSSADRRPIGYEVRYRDADGVQCTRGGFRRKRDADAYAVEIESTRQQGVVIPHSFGGVPLGEVADTAMLAVAAGEVDEAWFAGWLRDRVTFLGDQQPGGTGLS